MSKNKKIKKDVSLNKILSTEKSIGITSDKKFEDFQKKVHLFKKNFSFNIKFLKKKYKKIYGYGAPAKATTLLNFLGINNNLIYEVIDDNNLKVNKFIPGTNIKIISSKKIKKKQKIILVLAWNMFSEIKSNNKNLSYKFVNIRDLYDKNFIKNFSSN